jgi:uncharacterized UPF0160 family protein
MVRFVNSIQEANCITHNGTIHADEVFATAFLDMYLGDVKIFRTSSVPKSGIDESVLIYDVGRGKYDHHQIDAVKRDNGITYSSLGLLWKDFGLDFLKKNDFLNPEEMFLGIDKDLIEGIDGDDNGFFPKIDSIYKVKTLPGIIKIFNPSFDSGEDESEQFLKAVSLARMIWEEELYYIQGKVIAEKRVNQLLELQEENFPYLILDEFIPYEETILSHPKGESILFVAFPSNRGGYAIKTVPKSLDDHTARKAFPVEWAGLQNEDLLSASNIPGLRFCHSGRFIVNCDSLDTVYQILNLLCQDTSN